VDVTVLGAGASGANYGLHNDVATATLHGGNFTGRGGASARGIQNYRKGAVLVACSISVLAEHADVTNYGFSNVSAQATLRGGSFTGRGGTTARGMGNEGSDSMLVAEGVSALGKGATANNYGLENTSGGSATLHGGAFVGEEHVTRGIYNHGNDAMLTARRVTAEGRYGVTDHGMFNGSAAVATVDSSQLIGEDYGLYQSGGRAEVGVSLLHNGVQQTGGTLTCFQVYDETYGSYTCP
jgi:hypothetical protein